MKSWDDDFTSELPNQTWQWNSHQDQQQTHLHYRIVGLILSRHIHQTQGAITNASFETSTRSSGQKKMERVVHLYTFW